MGSDELRALIFSVNKAFYDRVYKDPWLKQVFQGVSQEHIERQQTDFMVGAFGGPKTYAGRSPADAHPHIFIDEEMWALRERLLTEAFQDVSFPEEMRKKWLKIDNAFKDKILKKSLTECKGRYAMEELIVVPNPAKRRAG